MKLRLIVSFLMLATAAAAQMTTVSGTVLDPNNVPYARGTITAVLILPGGQSPTLNGQPYTPPTQPVGLDSTGSFSFNIADNTQLQPGGTQWNFTVCSAVGTVQPSFGTASQCFTLAAPITISGASQSITTNLHAAALALTLPFSAGSMTGCVVSPATNNGIVWINLGNCTSGTNLTFVTSTNQLTVGANGQSTPGVVQVNDTSSTHGATFTTDAGGDQIIWSAARGALALVTPLTIDGDNSLTPQNFMRFQTGSGGFKPGIEFSLGGDGGGSGSAGSFKVVTQTSTLASSQGGPISLTAGNAQGVTNSPGGSVALTGGNSSGTSTGNPGGPVSLTAGTASGGNNLGGDVTLQAGNGVGTGRGGNINLNIGTGSPNGQVLCNGTPCFPGVLTTPSLTTCSSCPVSIANSNTTIITKSITFPGLGCPCRILVTYSLYLTTTTSGQDAAMVQDNTTQCSGAACVMATAQTATTGSASGFGLFGSGFSPTTYANGQTVIFTVVAASTHASGTSAVAAVAPSLTGAQSSYVNIAVLGSN
jgi:hypothetical protein